MNGLELNVGERGLDQNRRRRGFVMEDLADEGVEKLGGIGQQQSDPVEAPQRLVRLIEQAVQAS